MYSIYAKRQRDDVRPLTLYKYRISKKSIATYAAAVFALLLYFAKCQTHRVYCPYNTFRSFFYLFFSPFFSQYLFYLLFNVTNFFSILYTFNSNIFANGVVLQRQFSFKLLYSNLTLYKFCNYYDDGNGLKKIPMLLVL